MGPMYDRFQKAIDDTSRSWRQNVNSDAGKLGPSAPRHQIPSGEKLTGQKAILRIREVTNSGGLVQIPAWHSGFWITFRTPSEGTLIDLERAINDEKITLGRVTGGAIFSNTTVYLLKHVLDCALDHVYTTSIAGEHDLRELISINDIPSIIWGFACSIYRRGFQYARSVVVPGDDNMETTHIVREVLNLGKLQWVDTSALTEWQIAHMSRRASQSMNIDSIKRYVDEFTRGKPRKIDLTDEVSISLHVPNVMQHLNSGSSWVDSIVLMVDKAFGYGQDDQKRNEFILDHARASNMRQYAHWVKEIIINGDEIVDDTESIEMSLNELSSIDKVRVAYFEGISKYIEDTTISTIAVPSLSAAEDNKFPRFPHLYPLDTLQTFFTLLAQKTALIRSRG